MINIWVNEFDQRTYLRQQQNDQVIQRARRNRTGWESVVAHFNDDVHRVDGVAQVNLTVLTSLLSRI